MDVEETSTNPTRTRRTPLISTTRAATPTWVQVQAEVRGADTDSEKAMRELVGTSHSDSPVESDAAAIQRLARELAGEDEDFSQYRVGHDQPGFVPVFTVQSMRMLLPQAEVSA